jgi:hypothetical protein
MQTVIREFAAWFSQFIFVATLLMIVAHFFGSRMRAKKKLKLKEEQSS